MLGRSVVTRKAGASPAMGRLIEGGQVSCPIRGVVDIERCFICPAFDGIQEGTPERLVCRPDQDVAGVRMADESWDLD